MNRNQIARLLTVAIVAVAGLILLNRLGNRGESSEPNAVEAASGQPWSHSERSATLLAARQLLAQHADGLSADDAKATKARQDVLATVPKRGVTWLGLSLERSQGAALVEIGRGEDLASALESAVRGLVSRTTAEEIASGRLKIDLMTDLGPVQEFDDRGRAQLQVGLDGLFLPKPEILLLADEIVALQLVDRKGDLQNRSMKRYLASDARGSIEVEGNPGRSGEPYRVARFDTFLEDQFDRETVTSLYRANPDPAPLSPTGLLAASRAGGDYLVRHAMDDGDYGYNYEPWRDRYEDDYNLLRHAGTSYSLFELFQITGDERYLETGRRGVDALLKRKREPKPEDADEDFLAILSPGKEAKLGGAALAILAILEHREASPDESDKDRWMAEAEKLARFLLFMQDEDGQFESKYFYGKPDPVRFVSIYYPGEAILALVRLYKATGNERWLEGSRRGADWLIDTRDAGKATPELPHDHWLLMGLDELWPITRDDRYLRHGERIAEAILGAQRKQIPNQEHRDWLGTFYAPPRSTPTATRAEALVAMHGLATKAGRPTDQYLESLRLMAAWQLRCQIVPDNSFHLPQADRAAGGFRRSLENWEVRIDYVQHNISALLGLREILLNEIDSTAS